MNQTAAMHTRKDTSDEGLISKLLTLLCLLPFLFLLLLQLPLSSCTAALMLSLYGHIMPAHLQSMQCHERQIMQWAAVLVQELGCSDEATEYNAEFSHCSH